MWCETHVLSGTCEHRDVSFSTAMTARCQHVAFSCQMDGKRSRQKVEQGSYALQGDESKDRPLEIAVRGHMYLYLGTKSGIKVNTSSKPTQADKADNRSQVSQNASGTAFFLGIDLVVLFRCPRRRLLERSRGLVGLEEGHASCLGGWQSPWANMCLASDDQSAIPKDSLGVPPRGTDTNILLSMFCRSCAARRPCPSWYLGSARPVGSVNYQGT